jgi:glycerol-3-phosphate dehydrogenase
LVLNYGTEYHNVLRYVERAELPEALAVLRAEIRYAVKHEMAQTLADVVLRRTELGSVAPPSESYLRFAARVMRAEFGWTNERVLREIDAVQAHYRW